MNFISNIISKTKNVAGKALFSVNEGKIVWVSIDKISVDPEIKAIFNQNETEISNISEDMKANGYNPANPVAVSQDGVLVEGHTRYLAAQRSGIKKVAVVYKHFDSRQEMIEYAYKQQLHRRNLSEQDIFAAYKKLRELTDADGKKAKTDVEIAEELHISPRQIAKMKEVERKASPELMEAFSTGELTLNKAYNQMKEEMKPAEEKDKIQETESAVDVREPEQVPGDTADVQKTETVQESVPAVDSEKTDASEEGSIPKQKKSAVEKPAVEKLNLKFSPEDFAQIKTAAEKAELTVSDYAVKVLLASVQREVESATA